MVRDRVWLGRSLKCFFWMEGWGLKGRGLKGEWWLGLGPVCRQALINGRGLRGWGVV